MPVRLDHPALQRLTTLDPEHGRPAMGYQSPLDGLRALSVLAVIVYHGGFRWLSGGFFGVEVFFVVSGFLITSLLLEERERSGAVDLRRFWVRRARRLLPALFAMLVVVGVWGALWGSAQQQWQLRRDLPWGVFYVANWGQILGEVPYFAGGDPPLLRHLWSLAVEEQWYLLWPLLFVAIAAVPVSRRTKGAAVIGLACVAMVATWWLARDPNPSSERINLLYLSTFTRASGLLLGAGCAMWWRPWRAAAASPAHRTSRGLDVAGVLAIAALAAAFAIGHVDDRAVYRWTLPMVTIASAVAVLVAVHPASRLVRGALGWRPLTTIGRRSYGLYLWTWPVTVVCGAHLGWSSWKAFVAAMAIAVPVSEVCYRWIETPIRRGSFTMPALHVPARVGGTSTVALAALLVVFYIEVQPFDPARGGRDVAFAMPAPTTPAPTTVPATTGPETTVPPTDAAADEPAEPATAVVASTAPVDELAASDAGAGGLDAVYAPPVAPPVTAARLPRRVVVVGDSQAHSLAVNTPSGIGSTFVISDGSVDGCGVLEAGSVVSARGITRSFDDCTGWQDRWARSATRADADVALVVLGAWEVFDLRFGDRVVAFGTAEADTSFLDQLDLGIEAVLATGVHVALLEVPCMRPVDVEGAGVPALPERGDDTRVAHLNDLLRVAAASHPDDVTFVAGPTAWCSDPVISTDLDHRWDGVHVYRPGAALIYETIAPALLSIPLPG